MFTIKEHEISFFIFPFSFGTTSFPILSVVLLFNKKKYSESLTRMTTSTSPELFEYANFALNYLKNHIPIVKIKFYDPRTPNLSEIGTRRSTIIKGTQ